MCDFGDSRASVLCTLEAKYKKSIRKRDHLCQMLAGKDNDREPTIAFDDVKAVLMEC